MISGQINIVCSKGKEVMLNAGEKLTVTGTKLGKKNFPLDKISNYLETPSIYLPNLYSSSRSDEQLFPLYSKVLDKANIKFYNLKGIDGKTFKLFKEKGDSLVWQSSNFPEDFQIAEIPLSTGEHYYWRLYNGSNSEKGSFYMLTKAEQEKLGKKGLNCKNDYVDSFFLLLENKCFFDAAVVLNIARMEFPDSELIKQLANTIFPN